MTETKWLSEDEREAWLALVSIMFRLPGRVENQLRTEEDMSLAEYLVLAMLSEAPQRQHKMSALATATNTSQSRLSRIVARMEQDGLVTRQGRQDDRRVVIAEITPAGLERVKEAAPAHVRHVREIVFDRLSTEQVAQLREIGRALNCGDNARSVLGLD
ncbi:MarR family winged helix-turn-helix transcriptional regulator [Kocuria rhizophila]|uniref:MarR family winged helix-turn-helix transcriptional regulator n=1 Tax=Kocuria rhizophila TaxID=72000 RepID=UPI0021A67978|nr:MarR family transcriptional regulator [Kocuria rhizophila]MCT1917617.1 MarR family transcriptional regulator [Kocuria rhizophila]